MSEADEEFVKRIADVPRLKMADRARLFELALRGARVQWRPIEEAPRDKWLKAAICGGTGFMTANDYGGEYELTEPTFADWNPNEKRWEDDDCSGGYEEYRIYSPKWFIPLTALGEPKDE